MKNFNAFDLPPGPLIKDYDFRVTYYEQPISKEYEPIITQRLLAGEPLLAAVRGTPIRIDKARKLRRKLGLSRKDVRPEYALMCHSEYDGYDVVDMYINKHMTMEQIAKQANCSVNMIFKTLRRMGVHNAGEIRRKNPTKAEKERRIKLVNAARAYGEKMRLSPGKRKFRKWMKKHGARLMPLYEDVKNGMSMRAACQKHGVTMVAANYHFKRVQKFDNQCLAWGQKQKFPLFVTKAQMNYWVSAAQKSNNNVLDWIIKHLNAAVEANA